MEPPASEGERFRRMPLNKVADEAMDNVAEAHKKAGIDSAVG